MKNNITILNLFSSCLLLYMFYYLIRYYKYINIAQDFNLFNVAISFLIPVFGLIIDYIIRRRLKNRIIINILGGFIAIFLFIVFNKF